MTTQKQRILVTGGAGYVGSGVIRKLLDLGHDVICVDTLMFGGESLLDVWGHPRFTLEKVDINDFEQFNPVLAKHAPDSIVHLAAIVGDPACKLSPELATRTNRDAAMNLVDQCANNGTTRFVFASTCSNYGKMPDPESYVDETSELAPVSLYATLKVEFENYLTNPENTPDNFCPTALRFATVYGMSPRMRFDLTVNEFAKDVTLGRKLAIFGEHFWRPYCHVADFARAIALVLESDKDKVAYDVFNVGDTKENYTKKMIADILLQELPDCDIEYVKRDEDPRDYRVSFEKIKSKLGFEISKTVPEGIRDVISCVKNGIIDDPDSQRYFNIPVKT